MAEYIYARVLDTNTNLYSIDYPGEVTRLSIEIRNTLLSLTCIKTECNGTELKVCVEPTLTAEEKVTLDNLVANHT